MNILFIAQRVPYPPNKGEKIRTFHQLKFLHENGHKIHLVSPHEDDSEHDFFTELKKQYCASVITTKLPAKILRLFNGLIQHKPMSVANFYNKELQLLMDQLLSQQAIDVIICTASSMAEYVFNSQYLATAAVKPRLIMDFMDVDSDKWRQYAENSTLPKSWVFSREQRLLARYERQIVTQFDACYLIAQAEVDLFNRNVVASNKVMTLGNGMDMQSFYPPTSKVATSTGPTLLFTGVMDYKPNVDAVVWFAQQCWPQLRQRYPQACFIVAGMNPNQEVRNLATLDGIEITGFVDDILPYYHQANIFVAPFRLARGVQNKVLQAFACGLPVVSTPMGAEGIQCVAEQDILLASSPDEFLTQIERLYNQTDLAEHISESALRLVREHYSWEGQLQPLLTQITNQH